MPMCMAITHDCLDVEISQLRHSQMLTTDGAGKREVHLCVSLAGCALRVRMISRFRRPDETRSRVYPIRVGVVQRLVGG